ncbi:MAG TPA: nucleoside transporter C-terminal domain-containing protein [Saprospiraceae bacterium]|nr:nucleoside transporter C-terminal domain-containing protein [Saprospiraceae bacterium]
MMFIENLGRGTLGVAVLLGICYLLSVDRKAINWRLVIGGILLQLVLAVLILKVPVVYIIFQGIADGFVALLKFADAGAGFVFGFWPDEAWIMRTDLSATPPIQVPFKLGFMFAFRVLPTIVFFSAFSAILYYFGILQRIIYVFAWVMNKVMKLSGAESLAAAANVFIGQTEAPLVIKPYLEGMTKSEIMCLMTGGMATIAGGVFALFVTLLGPEYAIHFLTASIMSAPAAIVAAKMLFPEKHPERINRDLSIPKDKIGSNVLDAIALGTTDGVKLAVNVGAMLLVFLALIALLNAILMWAGDLSGLNASISASTAGRFAGLTLEYVLGLLFAPIAWVLGVPAQDILEIGQLLGKKTALNEVLAYVDLAALKNSETNTLLPKSVLIATYALCGFSNFSSIGIQIGGISAIAPSQRKNLTELGIKALIGGTIACFMTAAIVGIMF